jgi:menaquinone-dependent protoporphyrinogen oxidase
MTRILVVYDTTDGHTAKVAREIGVALRVCGAEAHVVRVTPTLDEPEGYAGVIVAASLHASGYQASVRSWVARNADALNAIPSAFVSVCLMAHNPDESAQLAEIIGRFVDGCGWRPTVRKPVAGALLYTRYGWLKRLVMKSIAAKTGGDTDTTRDYVYTDWDDLRKFASAFWHAVTVRLGVKGAA